MITGIPVNIKEPYLRRLRYERGTTRILSSFLNHQGNQRNGDKEKRKHILGG